MLQIKNRKYLKKRKQWKNQCIGWLFQADVLTKYYKNSSRVWIRNFIWKRSLSQNCENNNGGSHYKIIIWSLIKLCTEYNNLFYILHFFVDTALIPFADPFAITLSAAFIISSQLITQLLVVLVKYSTFS